MERDTTYQERATWGKCPVCNADDGEWCNSEIGLHIGTKINGSNLKTGEGVHLARIKKSPMRVKLIPA